MREAANWVHKWSWKAGHKGNLPHTLAADKFLRQFRHDKPIELHRFEVEHHDPKLAPLGGSPLESWSHNKKMVESIADDMNASRKPGEPKHVVKTQVFHPHQIYTDFTAFPEHFKKELEKHGGGSDMDEVLIWKGLKASSPSLLSRALRVERLARGIEALAVRASTSKRGCLMAMVRGTLEDDLLAWGKANIPDAVLDPVEGREDETHVTVLYGFNLDFDPARLMAMLRNHGEVRFTLGKVGRFQGERYDVIKVDVVSRELERLNWRIAKTFAPDITPSEHEYHPHLTLAYVAKGAVPELDGSAAFEGRAAVAVELLYSLPERKGRQTVSLDYVDAADGTERDGVRASAFGQVHNPEGHNQWGGQGTPHADPPGEPWGKIRHAVLVIGGKRWRGPSHFQALQHFEAAGGKYSNEGLNAEGFETESGHFLDRDQAAEYVHPADLSKSGVKRFGQMAGKKWLAAQDVVLKTVDGLLYTQDAVQAAGFEEQKHPRDEHGQWRSGEGVKLSQVYHSPLRPVMSISHYLPKGWELHGEVKNLAEHRTFRVPKPLTSEQVKQWELEPADPHHPVNIKKRYQKFHEETVDKYAEKGALQMKMPSGASLIVSETIGDEKYPFRITRLLPDGTPSGHETFKDFDEVTRHLFGFPEGVIQAKTPREAMGCLIQAAQPVNPVLAEHDRIRAEAQARYKRAVDRAVAAAEAQAVADLKRKEESEAKRRKRREEELAAAALLLALAGAAIYRRTSVRLAALLAPGAAYNAPTTNLGPTTAPQPTNAPTGVQVPPVGLPAQPGATPVTPGTGSKGGGLPTPAGAEEAEGFAESRRPLLEPFCRETRERLEEEARSGRAQGLTDAQIADRLTKAAAEIEGGRGRVVSETEAQACYGGAQIRLLRDAGFSHKVWTTMDDDVVRDSHRMCESQGEVPIDKPFSNGLMYPGDPVGGPEDVINCRCWLTGSRRVPGKGHLKASEPVSASTPRDVSGEARDAAGKWTAGGLHKTMLTKEGQPKAFFHGKSGAFKDVELRINPNNMTTLSGLGPAWFTTNKSQAERFAVGGNMLVPKGLDIKRPLVVYGTPESIQRARYLRSIQDIARGWVERKETYLPENEAQWKKDFPVLRKFLEDAGVKRVAGEPLSKYEWSEGYPVLAAVRKELRTQMEAHQGSEGTDPDADPFGKLYKLIKEAKVTLSVSGVEGVEKMKPGEILRRALEVEGYDGVVLLDTMADTKTGEEPADWVIPLHPRQVIHHEEPNP